MTTRAINATLAGSVFVVWALACGGGPRDTRPPEVKAAAERAPAVSGTDTASAAARAAYLPKVTIRGVKATSFTGGLENKPMASVEAEIKNTGDRTLSEVDITIYFLDKDGKRVHEHTSYPVLAGGFTADSSTPLKANYTRRWSGAMDVPTDWAGKVEAKITDVKFADEEGSK